MAGRKSQPHMPIAPPPVTPSEAVRLPSPGEALVSFVSACADLLYPPVCLICRRRLLASENICCLHCIAKLAPALDWQCARCGARGAGEPPETGRPCRLCPPADSSCIGIFAVTGYFAESARAVHLFKYGRRIEVGEMLAALTADALAPDMLSLGARIDLITPVPLHWTRRYLRGFNQSLLLARALAKATSLPLEAKLLHRTRYTRRQALVPHERRAQNVRDAFALRAGADLRGRGVLLIDDVVTTGHTIHECSRMLRENGAREVWVACFARAGVWKPEQAEAG